MASLPSPNAPPVGWQLDDLTMMRLADELARDMYPTDDVLRRFALDPLVFNQIVRVNPTFIKHYSEYHAKWHSTANSGERVKLKSKALVEEWLVELNRQFHDMSLPLSAKVEAMKLLSKIAGLDVDTSRGNITPGERVQVTINLSAAGAQPVLIDKLAPVIAPVIDVTPERL
jgi:hypothetical protein